MIARCLVSALLALALIAPADALAADTISLGTTPSPPLGAQVFHATASGNVDSGDRTLWVTIDGPADTCAAYPWQDFGGAAIWQVPLSSPGGYSVTGSQQLAEQHGDWQLCGWLTDSMDNVVAATHLIFTIKDPSSITINVDPDPTIAGRQTAISATGALDQEADVYVTSKPGGGSCAPTAAGDTGTSQLSQIDVGGPTYNVTGAGGRFSAGSYLLCGWVYKTGDPTSGTPLATTSRTLEAGAPTASLTLDVPGSVSYGTSPIAVDAHWHSDTPAALWVAITPLATNAHCSDRRNAMRNPTGDLAGYVNQFGPGSSYTGVGPPFGGFSDAPAEDGVEHLDAGRVSQSPGSYLICGWVQTLTDQGAGDPASTPLAGPVEKRLTVVPPIVYKGKTSRHKGIAFWVVGSQVLNLNFNATVFCPRRLSGPLPEPVSLDTFTLGRGGRMSFVGSGGGKHLKLAGRIRGPRASGTLTLTYAIQRGALCRSGKLRWSAKRVPYKG